MLERRRQRDGSQVDFSGPDPAAFPASEAGARLQVTRHEGRRQSRQAGEYVEFMLRDTPPTK